MNVRVKICGLTDRQSVAAAVAAGADAIGFVFYEKSPRNLTLDRAIELAAGVPGNVLKIAVMLHPDATACDAILTNLVPDVLQTDLSDFEYLKLPGHIRQWPVIRENKTGELQPVPDRFVYEGSASGQGMQVDWSLAAAHARHGDMILAGGLNAGNVAEAIRRVAPWGVDVSSAVESAPGIKDPHKIRAFIAAARAAGSNKETTNENRIFRR